MLPADIVRILKEIAERGLAAQRSLILPQVLGVQGLMCLLMKVRNTGEAWTPEELREIRGDLWDIARIVPVIVVFILPGGTFLLPVLAKILDRRTALKELRGNMRRSCDLHTQLADLRRAPRASPH